MTWTNITNAQVASGAALTTGLVTALRDNPAAIANGDSGAPRITAEAHGNPGGGGFICGGFFWIGANPISNNLSGMIQVGGAWNALSNGITTVRYAQRVSVAGSGDTCSVTVYKNGVVQSTLTTTSATWVQRSLNIAITAGDVIAIGLQKSAGTGGGSAQIIEVRMTCDLQNAVIGG